MPLSTRVLAAPALLGAAVLPAQERPGIDYAAVRPILEANCYECHGETRRRNGLRVDDRESVLVGGRGGPAVVIGRSEESLLIRRVTGADGLTRMPWNREPLSEAEIQVLRDWIDRGLDWPESGETAGERLHWAYREPVRRPPPAVARGDWLRNSIDAFILAELEQRGLEPSEDAERETLIRRASMAPAKNIAEL